MSRERREQLSERKRDERFDERATAETNLAMPILLKTFAGPDTCPGFERGPNRLTFLSGLR